jgi:membrane-associated phospholipid phosphatase
VSHHRRHGEHQVDPPADGPPRLAPPWAAVAITVAVLITGSVGALVWRSERLGSIDAWALREFGAHSYREFQLASGIAASLRPVALVGTAAIAGLAWVALRRWNGVILSLAAPAVTFVVEKLLKQLVARRSPGVSVFLYPSGHLAVATALALTLILVVRSAGARPSIRVSVIACASLFVLVMARARLAETAHSLSDVVGGVATGAAVTLAAALLLDIGMLRSSAIPHQAPGTCGQIRPTSRNRPDEG